MKKLIMFSMVIAIAVPLFSGIASAQNAPVCITICPAGAGPDDEITLTGYDEEGVKVDFSQMGDIEMNWWPIEGGVIYPGDPEASTIEGFEMVDGSVVGVLGEDRYNAPSWDFFTWVPNEWDAWLPIAMPDFSEGALFDNVPDVVDAGGTCEELANCDVALPAITVDSNDMPVYEPADAGGPPVGGPTEGQLLVSLAWRPGEGLGYPAFTATVTVDPNAYNDGPNDDFIFPDSIAGDGSVTLSFSDANWSDPQPVTVEAVADLYREGNEYYPIELTVTIDIADPNFGNPTPVVVTSSVGVVDNDVPFVSVNPDEIEISESDPCTCVDLKVRLSHLPTDDVYVRVYPEGWPFGADDKAEMASLDPPLGEADDPNKLKFTPGNWNVEQTITVCPIDNDELAEAWLEYVDGEIFMPSYSEDVRYLVPWWNPDGSEADNPETDPEETSDGEADEAIVVVIVQDNECGAVGFPPQDYNEDCRVGLADFAHYLAQWLTCTEPYDNADEYPVVPSVCDKLWILVPPEE